MKNIYYSWISLRYHIHKSVCDYAYQSCFYIISTICLHYKLFKWFLVDYNEMFWFFRYLYKKDIRKIHVLVFKSKNCMWTFARSGLSNGSYFKSCNPSIRTNLANIQRDCKTPDYQFYLCNIRYELGLSKRKLTWLILSNLSGPHHL